MTLIATWKALHFTVEATIYKAASFREERIVQPYDPLSSLKISGTQWGYWWHFLIDLDKLRSFEPLKSGASILVHSSLGGGLNKDGDKATGRDKCEGHLSHLSCTDQPQPSSTTLILTHKSFGLAVTRFLTSTLYPSSADTDSNVEAERSQQHLGLPARKSPPICFLYPSVYSSQAQNTKRRSAKSTSCCLDF